MCLFLPNLYLFNYITGLNTYLAEIDMCVFITHFIFVVIYLCSNTYINSKKYN